MEKVRNAEQFGKIKRLGTNLVVNTFFRVDSSIQMGTGHLMRCLALADELRGKGAEGSFICRKDAGNLIEYIEKKGYRVYPLPADIDLLTDRDLTQKILHKQQGLTDWLIIDHYGINASWETPLRKFAKKIMVIDDLADRKHDCDILLDQNYNKNGSRYNGLVPENCIQLLGPKYALLRPQFREARENFKRESNEVKRILVFMGGADPNNETGKVLRALKLLNRDDIAIEVVIGASNPFRREIETISQQMSNTTSYFNINNIAELMTSADLGIGASGTITWERCCLGLPIVVMILAANQKEIAEELEREGAIVNLGWHEDVTEMDIRDAVENLLTDSDKRKKMSLNSMEMVDGKGVVRASQYISSSGDCIENIYIKNADDNDINDLFKWRNNPEIRKNFFDTAPVSRETHEKWFREKVNDIRSAIYMVYCRENKIGSVRFENKENAIKTSVLLSPDYIGKGLGAEIIRIGTDRFIKGNSPTKPIIAEIKKENVKSIKAFQKAGFKESYVTYVFPY